MRARAVRLGTTFGNLIVQEIIRPIAQRGMPTKQQSEWYVGLDVTLSDLRKKINNYDELQKELRMTEHNVFLRRRVNCSVVAQIDSFNDGMSRIEEIFY